jgi:hypothetical protein
MVVFAVVVTTMMIKIMKTVYRRLLRDNMAGT